MQNLSLRILFLRELVRQIILIGYSTHIENAKLDYTLSKLKEWKQQKAEKQTKEKALQSKPLMPLPNLSLPSVSPTRNNSQFFQSQKQILRKASLKPMPQKQTVQISSNKYNESMMNSSSRTELGKLMPLLSDFSIQSVECPGSGKPILLNRRGISQTSPVSLTTDEINQIMKNISDKTRIPLIPGLFKAAFDNYLVTAVLSDFVGTRFIIQRKLMPTQPRFR